MENFNRTCAGKSLPEVKSFIENKQATGKNQDLLEKLQTAMTEVEKNVASTKPLIFCNYTKAVWLPAFRSAYQTSLGLQKANQGFIKFHVGGNDYFFIEVGQEDDKIQALFKAA